MFEIPNHIKKIGCPFDRKAAETEFLTAQIELELKEKTSEYYPFTESNFNEAIQNSDLSELLILCEQDSIFSAPTLRHIVIEYWREVLKHKYL